VPSGGVKFFGTATWDNEVLFADMTMNSAEYAALPAVSPGFERVYENIAGAKPNRMDSFAYDAAQLSISALRSNKFLAAYLLDPSGYIGLDGIVRLRPNGDSERALAIMRLDASGTPKVAQPAPRSFVMPIYQSYVFGNRTPAQIEITDGVNPLDYISIPSHLSGKYSAKVYKLSNVGTPKSVAPSDAVPIILPEDDREPEMSDPDFQPTQMDTIDRVLIDSVEVRQR